MDLKNSKKVLRLAFICQLFISTTTELLIYLSSPDGWGNQSAYNLILGNFPRITLSNLVSIIISGYININLLVKWKILLKGRCFWFRSVGSSVIAEILYSSLAVFLIGYAIFRLLIGLSYKRWFKFEFELKLRGFPEVLS